LVLARKYRPATFSEVVGQDHVTRTIRNAFSSGRLGHAFLFSGLRGVGKTSVARILAKTLNCTDEHHTDEPCGQCESCREIDEGRSLNVLEMDAASHTGVDDIRDLRESVMYAASGGKYKVYIIDEVHMLSKNAFNALLKTLEEPPPHVIFILATTEPHKVPITIHSRCQRYDFRRISSADITGHLEAICSKEGVEISKDSLRRIAIASEGSLRDSQSILDQVLSYAGQQVKDEDVNVVLGSLDRGKLTLIFTACTRSDPGTALKILGEMIDNGADPVRIALDLLDIIRTAMILVEVDDPEGLIDMPEGELEALKSLSGNTDPAVLRVQFALLARGEERMRRSSQQRIHLELALVHMARAGEIAGTGAGSGPSSGKKKPAPPIPDKEAGGAADSHEGTASPELLEPDAVNASEPVSAPAFAGIETPKETWEQLVDFVNERAPGIGSMLEQLIPRNVAGEELVIGGKRGEIYLEVLQEREKIEELAKLANEFFNREMKVKFVEMEAEERARNHNVVEKRQLRESDLARKIKRETREHPMVKEALEIFDGDLKSVKVLGKTVMEPEDPQTTEEEI
ncbi:MAG: DNA polymerase III subunit gamma/tau, partial [Pseudomonadota bacterium]